MNHEQFRRQLKAESWQWRQEGLINTVQYDSLVDRYGFNQLGEEPSNRFIGILLGLGGILLGLGLITFVAANWQAWSRLTRMVLLLTLFFSINGVGFYLWRHPHRQTGLHRLGHGLLLTGGLSLGANIGLMSQMFHQSGPVYQLFFIWGIGVLSMAYGLRLASLGALSWVLVMISYWSFALNSLLGSLEGDFWTRVMFFLPLLISLLYLPLAHWLRSRWLYGLWGLGWMGICWWSLAGSLTSYGLLGAIALVLPTTLLWVYRMDWHVRSASRRSRGDRFLPIGQSLALWSMGISFSLFAFKFPWGDLPFPFYLDVLDSSQFLAVAMLVVYLAIAAYEWARMLRQKSSAVDRRWLTPWVMATIQITMYGLAMMYYRGVELSIAPILVNLLLFSLSLILIHDGLVLNARGRFWGGMSLLVLGIICRMFEYNTELTLKATVLSLCGLGVMVAGLWFEYRMKQTPQAALSEHKS